MIALHHAGMAHKGTSVVLYRWPALRQHQYTAITDWSGGLYISPGFAGSRSVSAACEPAATKMNFGTWIGPHVSALPRLALLSITRLMAVICCMTEAAPQVHDSAVYMLQGALIATAWTALMHLGEQGYLDHTARIMKVNSATCCVVPTLYNVVAEAEM